MVHYIALYKLNGIANNDEVIEEMIRLSRACLHRINEAHNFRSGRSIRDENEFAFFISADFESLAKLKMFQGDPQYRRFEAEVISENTCECRELLYETEPGKNRKYS